MMKKILTKLGVALSILALSAFVTACGGDDGGTTTPAEPAPEDNSS